MTNPIANDRTDRLRQAVADALAEKTPLTITGGGSKVFYGRETTGKVLSVEQHRGIVNYYPSELVVTARAGTLLSDLQSELTQAGQMLAFEPPSFNAGATLGGTVACGFSGPRRPFTGSVRDFVLGCRIINGKAEVLSFGGEVIKNVAGYDVSRLMAGALGTLGVLLEISLKVLPLPEAELTCCFELDAEKAFDRMTKLANKALSISGLSYDGYRLYVRFSGAEKAVRAAAAQTGGDAVTAEPDYWRQLNEQRHEFFQTGQNLWRLCLPSATPPLALEGHWYYDWGGGLRWLKSEEPAARIFALAAQAQGHAVLFKGQDRTGDVFQPLTGKLQEINAHLKKAFDPAGLFNPGRMYREW